MNTVRVMRVGGGIWGLGVAWLFAAVVAIHGCDRGATTETPVAKAEAAETDTGDAERASAKRKSERVPDEEGLQIGVFPLADEPVVDGDTIRLRGVEGSIRLLSIDTEEKLHGKADRTAANEDFAQYLRRKRRNSVRPSKTGTPMGEEATAFAKTFFADAELVRLERDDPKNIRGYFGRLLAYAFVKKDGRWTSYNVECVRAGMSPYFTKYGYSRRFHNQFSHAEMEAREAERGIWNPSAEGYGDYEERREWWNARADFIRAFEHEANGRDGYIPLTNWDATRRLEDRFAREVTVLSTVERIQHFKGLVRVSLARTGGKAFPVIFFDKDVFRESGIERYKREPVTVRGTVERYEKGEYSTLQIVVRSPAQLGLPSLPWPEDAN